jgi:soluble lytic murein transglycosylase-like protein
MHHFISLMRRMVRRRSIPLFAEKPSHPSVPLDFMSAIARSRGQGRSQTGACALPLTEVSPVASCRQLRGGTTGIIAFLLISGLCAIAAWPNDVRAEEARIERQYSYRAYSAHIVEASRRFRIPADWIRAVIRAESAGAQRALSPKGAMGLMQIMPDTWDELRIRYRLGKDPYDPRDNILAGAAYLRELHDHYGSPGFLAAYNAGPKRYEDYLSRKRLLPRETRAYVAALLPFVNDGDRRDRAIVVTNDQHFQAQLSIFVSREKQRSNPFPAHKEFHTEIDGTAPFARDISGIVPLSEGLFVARTKEAGQ